MFYLPCTDFITGEELDIYDVMAFINLSHLYGISSMSNACILYLAFVKLDCYTLAELAILINMIADYMSGDNVEQFDVESREQICNIVSRMYYSAIITKITSNHVKERSSKRRKLVESVTRKKADKLLNHTVDSSLFMMAEFTEFTNLLSLDAMWWVNEIVSVSWIIKTSKEWRTVSNKRLLCVLLYLRKFYCMVTDGELITVDYEQKLHNLVASIPDGGAPFMDFHFIRARMADLEIKCRKTDNKFTLTLYAFHRKLLDFSLNPNVIKHIDITE